MDEEKTWQPDAENEVPETGEELDWQELERSRREQNRERKEALWEALATQGEVPGRELLEQLSGLLLEDIQRVRRLWNDLDQTSRRELIETLIEMAEEDFQMDFTAIFRIALQDEDPEIRASAIEGLYEVQDVRLVPEFVRMLKEDPSPLVREAAAEALAKYVLLGELQKIRPEPFEAAVAALIEAYGKEGEGLAVQRRAVESVAYTGSHEVPEMIAAAYRCDEEEMKVSAVFAMGRSADERWGEIVQVELRNPSPEMRFEATRACGEIQLRAAVRDLVELAEDVNPAIRLMALWSLGQIGGDVARRTLQRYAESDEEAMQEAAEEALQELEFFHGDLSAFFGPPEEFDGESDIAWDINGRHTQDDLYDEDDDESHDHEHHHHEDRS